MKANKHIGLFFGSFNPIHVGHLIIANHMVEFGRLDQIWLVVSPQNPFKEKSSLLGDIHRLNLARIATEENSNIEVSSIEFDLPQPSYTVHTLAHLREKYPDYRFSLIMGEDNLRSLHKWKNVSAIIQDHSIYVYPRVRTIQEEGKDLDTQLDSSLIEADIHKVDGPILDISASFIRKTIKAGKSASYLVTPDVEKYIEEMHFYKK